MMKRIIICSLALMWLGFGLETNVSASDSKGITIDIVHTNDVHGHAQVWPYVKGLADQLRAENPNVSIIDAGDAFAGTPFASLSDGLDVARVMNQVGYELMTIGNHEYAMTPDMLKGIEQASDFPFLGLNVEAQIPGILKEIPSIKGFVIKEYEGVKVAYLGLTTSMKAQTGSGQLQGDYRVAMAEQLREQAIQEGADLFVAVAHLGDTDPDETMRSTYLADHCPWLTAIVDGHSHSEHQAGFMRNGVLVAQTGEYGNNIGVLSLQVSSEDKQVTAKSEKLIRVRDNEAQSGIIPDADVQAIVDEVTARNDLYLSEVLFTTPVELIGDKPIIRSQETNFGDLVADAYRSAGQADVAFAASVTIRQNIAAGPVTRETLLSSLGSEQRLLKYEVKGQKLWEIMENALGEYPDVTNYFQQVSGMMVSFDPKQEKGQRILGILMADGKQIDLKKSYSLVIREDMPDMTDVTGELGTMPFVAVGKVYPDFIKYAQEAAGNITSKPDGRLLVVDKDDFITSSENEPTDGQEAQPVSTPDQSVSEQSKSEAPLVPVNKPSQTTVEPVSQGQNSSSSPTQGKLIPATGERLSNIPVMIGTSLLMLVGIGRLIKRARRP